MKIITTYEPGQMLWVMYKNTIRSGKVADISIHVSSRTWEGKIINEESESYTIESDVYFDFANGLPVYIKTFDRGHLFDSKEKLLESL